ncbi:MAG: hypothetical protein HRT47_03205 [Candidatus Caenarcaniphilales bacterium]|nr:hypothetical protein [Candidatus Caenarcaniphilales bacterium]
MNSVDTTNPNQTVMSQNSSKVKDLAKNETENLEIPEIQDLNPAELEAKKQGLEDLLHKDAVGSEEMLAANELENQNSQINPQASEVKTKEEGLMDKFLKFMTYGNFGVNAISIGLSSLALKNNNLDDTAEKGEKVGLSVNKMQAITLGAGFIKEAFETKNIMLLFTGIAQALKLPSGYNRLFRLAGIPSALDQLPAAINPITGKKKYESFKESWQMGTKVIKDVWNEFASAPIKFLKYLDPKSQEATKPLIPASIFMAAGAFLSNIFDFPIFGALRKPLVALGSLPRHGGGFVGDYSLLMDKNNHHNRKAGFLYTIGTAADYLGILANEKVGHIMHQMSYLFFPLAEMFLIKGSSSEDESDTNTPKNGILDFKRQEQLEAIPA